MDERPAPMPWYDWLMAIAAMWMSGGMMIDSWHHFHEDIETFFEPGHAVLYAGLAAAYAVTVAAVLVNRRKGYPLLRALPDGYQTTLAGLVVFAIGGLSDLIKHTMWGFEQFFDALVSPTHLVIGLGMFLIIAGTITGAFARKRPPVTLLAQMPMLLAAASMMELIHWGLQYVFFTNAERMNAPLSLAAFPHDTLTLLTLHDYKQGIGLAAVTFQGLLLAGFVVYLGRHIKLPAGAVTVLFLVGNAFIAFSQSNYAGQIAGVIAASLAAGICADAFGLAPGAGEVRWASCAFLTPMVYWGVNLGVLALTMGGIWWTPDVTAGALLFSGFAGLFVNALGMPVRSARNGACADGGFPVE